MALTAQKKGKRALTVRKVGVLKREWTERPEKQSLTAILFNKAKKGEG